MNKAIVVTGTPATGKTTVAKAIANKLNLKYIDVNYVIRNHNLSEGYDDKMKCDIVDTSKLNRILKQIIKDSDQKLVIDSHLSHYLPKSCVELCIVTKCELKELKQRLEKRGYSKAKVRENLDAEIFDLCRNEAKEKGHNVIVIDTSEGSKDIDDVLEEFGFLKHFEA